MSAGSGLVDDPCVLSGGLEGDPVARGHGGVLAQERDGKRRVVLDDRVGQGYGPAQEPGEQAKFRSQPDRSVVEAARPLDAGVPLLCGREVALEVFMKTLRFLLVSLLIVSIGLVTSSFGGEFYVVKSRSGLLRIVDHLPKGGATVVNGPFSSKEEASKAMKTPTQGTGDTVEPPSGGGPNPIK